MSSRSRYNPQPETPSKKPAYVYIVVYAAIVLLLLMLLMSFLLYY